jgi:sensor histidine kinase YesM
MEPYGNNLKIDVSATIDICGDTPCLVIKINDNGMGFDVTEVGTDSVGLSNIIERLELFDSRSSFSVNSKPGNGCRCEIILPIDEEEENEEEENEGDDF